MLILKFRKSLVASGLILSLLIPQLAWAQAETETDQKIDLVADFFTTAIDSENFFATFDDFFDQNECKRLDLYDLIDKRDRMANIIRRGILDENVEVADVRQNIQLWQLLSAELYILRNIDQLENDEDLELRNEVFGRYGANSAVNDRSIRYWFDKYRAKIDDYNNCEASFRVLGRKWREIKAGIRTASNNFTNSLNELYDEATALKDRVTTDIANRYNALFDEELDFFTDNSFIRFKTDFGPLARYESEGQRSLADEERQINVNPVAETVRTNSDADLVRTLEQSTQLQTSASFSYYTELAASNDLLTYKNADYVITAMWDEAQRTPTLFREIKNNLDENNDLSLTSRLEHLNNLQCRE